MFNLTKGLLEGLKFPNVDILMKWVNNVPDMYNDILEIINLLENIDLKHILQLIEAITKIFNLVDTIIKDLAPWADIKDSDYIKFIIDKI